VGGGHPQHVGVEEKEEDQTNGHEVHIDEEENAAVIEAPPALHTAEGVECAENGDQCWQDEQGRATVVREVRERERDCDAEKNEESAA
jgi:hypothetical protein